MDKRLKWLPKRNKDKCSKAVENFKYQGSIISHEGPKGLAIWFSLGVGPGYFPRVELFFFFFKQKAKIFFILYSQCESQDIFWQNKRKFFYTIRIEMNTYIDWFIISTCRYMLQLSVFLLKKCVRFIVDVLSFFWHTRIVEPQHDKIDKMACVHIEDSDLAGYLPNLIGLFSVCSMGDWGPSVSSCGQRSLWSDLADVQADLSLRWAHKLFCWFCRAVAHLEGNAGEHI